MLLCPVVSHLVSAGDGSRRIPGTAFQRRPKSSRSAGEVKEEGGGGGGGYRPELSPLTLLTFHIGELPVDELAVC